MSNEDKLRTIAYTVKYLRLSGSGNHYDLFGYSNHLLEIFGSWNDILKFIDTNSFFFSFYGIGSVVKQGIMYYRGKLVYY